VYKRQALEGERDMAMRNAEALQTSAIQKITRAFGERLIILSPAKPTRKDDADKFVAYGAGIIYVHSKVLIVDGHTALVGSANLNDRSLQWDTEASALWHDCDGVTDLFQKIGASWLGDDHGPLGETATCRVAAEKNRAVAPDLRDGFLLPYVLTRASRLSRRAFWLPDALF